MQRKWGEVMMKKRGLVFALCFLMILVLFFIGIKAFQDRRYLLVSVVMAFLACVPFYYAYEKRSGSIRRMVLLAVMIAMAVAGRVLFSPLPGIKPVSAIVILASIYMGAEAGFLIGSMSAIVSNLFFGQGPWTPFQMLAWGLVGFFAGLPILREHLKIRWCVMCYGVFSGIFYSFIMNIWAVISFDGSFALARFWTAVVTSLPTTLGYVAADVAFLFLLSKPFGAKLQRIAVKHEIF